MDKNKEKANRGVKIVIKELSKQGYNCEDVTKKGKEHKGYDIFATKGNEQIKIEVKTSHSENGIPDCYRGEFDRNLKVKADFFYIVRLNKETDKLKRIEILSKEEIDRYSDNHKIIEGVRTIRLDTDLKNKKIGRIISF